MERLTEHELIDSGEVCCIHEESDCNDSCMYSTCKWNDKALLKLKEYEDTGLTPQNIICREDDIKLLQRQNKEFREEIYKLREERNQWECDAIASKARLGEIRTLIGDEL